MSNYCHITLMILSLTYSDELKYGDYVFPSWSIIFGWCLNMGFILPIPIVVIYVFVRYSDPKKSLKQRICLLFVPTITKRRLEGPTEYQTTWLKCRFTYTRHCRPIGKNILQYNTNCCLFVKKIYMIYIHVRMWK